MSKRNQTVTTTVFFLVFGASYILLRLFFLRYRDFNVDEFEHLHAAWCIAHGQVLYRDFFEHHGPLWYGMLQFIPRHFHDPFQALWAGRALSMVFWAGILILQWYLVEPEWPPLYRAISVMLLCSFTAFADKSLEIRPDVPNAFLASLILVLGLNPLTTTRRALIGFCFGMGLLFSPKMIYPIGAYMGVLAIERKGERRSGFAGVAHFLGPIFLASLTPFLVCFWYMSSHNALKSFYECFWRFNLHLKPVDSSFKIFIEVVKQNVLLWTLAFLGLWKAVKNRPLKWAFIAAVSGLFLTHFVYRQNYLYVGPLLCFCATAFCFRFFNSLGESGSRRRMRWWWIGFTAFLIPPFWLQATDWKSNVEQLRRIQCVMHKTGPNDAILSFTEGDAFWRPHAYYYWWLLPNSRQTFSLSIVEAGVLNALLDSKCRGIIYESDYFKQHPVVAAYAQQNYHSTECGKLYLRNSVSENRPTVNAEQINPVLGGAF